MVRLIKFQKRKEMENRFENNKINSPKSSKPRQTKDQPPLDYLTKSYPRTYLFSRETNLKREEEKKREFCKQLRETVLSANKVVRSVEYSSFPAGNAISFHQTCNQRSRERSPAVTGWHLKIREQGEEKKGDEEKRERSFGGFAGRTGAAMPEFHPWWWCASAQCEGWPGRRETSTRRSRVALVEYERCVFANSRASSIHETDPVRATPSRVSVGARGRVEACSSRTRVTLESRERRERSRRTGRSRYADTGVSLPYGCTTLHPLECQ